MSLRQAWINVFLALFRQTCSSNSNSVGEPRRDSTWLLCGCRTAGGTEQLSGWTCAADPQLCQHRLHVAPESWTSLQGSSAKAFEVWGVVWDKGVPGEGTQGSVCGRVMESKPCPLGQAGQCHSAAFPWTRALLLDFTVAWCLSSITQWFVVWLWASHSTLLFSLPPFDCLVCLGWK